MRWRWPPDSCAPSSPTIVARPSGSVAIQSASPARRSARAISASVADGRARRTFSRMLDAKRWRVLAAHGDVAADVGLREVADVGARERDPPALGVHEAQQEVHDRRLAGARRAAQRDVPARGEPEVDAVEDGGLVRGVARTDALERQLRGTRGRREGDVGIADRRLAVGQVQDPPPRGQDARQPARRLRQRLHALERRQSQQRQERDAARGPACPRRGPRRRRR